MVVSADVRDPAQRETYTTAEVITELGIPQTSLFELVAKHAFPVKPPRIGRRFSFSKAKIDALIAGELSTADPDSA